MNSSGRPPPVTVEMFGRAHDVEPGQIPSAEDQAAVYACFQFYAKNAHLMSLDIAFGISGRLRKKFYFVRRDEALRKFLAESCPTEDAPLFVCHSIRRYQPIFNRGRTFADPLARWLYVAFHWASLTGREMPDGYSTIRAILSGQDVEDIDERLPVKSAV